MKYFRDFLLHILILTVVVTDADADNLFQGVACVEVAGLNFIRCVTPPINFPSSSFNCRTDCICIHGLSRGICTSSNQCICHNDENLNGEELANRRELVCGTGFQQLSQRLFMKALCPGIGISDTCDVDCRCGHSAKSGVCVDGYTLSNGKTFKVCDCLYVT